MLFRIPEKIDSVRNVMSAQGRAEITSHVKGFRYDQNLGQVAKPIARRGKDKWKTDKKALIPQRKKKQVVVTNRTEYGLFD